MTFISRRDLLKRVGATAIVVPSVDLSGEAAARSADAVERSADLSAEASAEAGGVALQGKTPLENFTSEEADLMDAIVARLIPADEHGPGAVEARAVHYIDRALGSALASSRQAYSSGLAALDRYARSSRGAPFRQLSPVDQDSVLIDVETGAATGFTGSSAVFFAMVLSHTHQGTFGDPYYGGNAGLVGWDLIRYPGVRTMVTAADQKALEHNELKPNRKSAYDYESFTKG
jgi:gluconate 2-dehydrogenase gamma chain